MVDQAIGRPPILFQNQNQSNAPHTSEQQPIPYFETSAKDATRVEAAFLEAAQLALQQTATQEKDDFFPDTINLAAPAPRRAADSSSACC